MIQNSGGAGIDYMTLKDRLRFSAEMWDFGGDDDLNAHAKLTGRFYFSPSVFVIGGWDDLLNTKANRDSLFLGAGVRWGDDDMKYLAGRCLLEIREAAVGPPPDGLRVSVLRRHRAEVAGALPGLRRLEFLRRGGPGQGRPRVGAGTRAAVRSDRGHRLARRAAAGDRAFRDSTACSAEGSWRARSCFWEASPGIGKSTLLFQAGRGLAAAGSGDVLYASAEESAAQVRLRAERLGIRDGRLLVLAGDGRLAHRRRGRGAQGLPRAGRGGLRSGRGGSDARLFAGHGLAGPRRGWRSSRGTPRRAECRFSSWGT